MKKAIRFIVTALIAATLLVCLTLSGSAATDFTKVKPEEYIVIMNSYVETTDSFIENGQYCMRGFAVSPDGKYAFGGFLNPSGTAALNMFDLATGMPVGSYVHEQADGGKSYPKGIAVDDRGYVYAGMAYYPNYGSVDYAILSYTDKGELTEQGFYNVVTVGTPGDKSGTQMGVNGVTVEKLDGKYYMYLVVNYSIDQLYRFDVTDPKAPVLDKSFGTDGFVDLAVKHSFKEAQYLDVDTDGTIYLGGTTQTDSGVFVLSADGNSLLSSASCSKGYAVCIWEDYLFVTTQSGPTAVNVFDKVTLNPVTTIACHDGANSYVHVDVVDGILYLGDQGSGDGDYDGIIVAALTDESAKLIADRKAAFAAALTTEAPAVTTETPAVTTAKPEAQTTLPPEASDTAKPADNTTAAGADETKAPVTDAPEKEKGGCGSVLALTALIPAAFAPVLIIENKKKK